MKPVFPQACSPPPTTTQTHARRVIPSAARNPAKGKRTHTIHPSSPFSLKTPRPSVIPFLEIVSEQDKLAGERKIVDIMVNKFDGKARHSDLMNLSHMKKREFGECVASLIEREAVRVDTERVTSKRASKIYLLDESIISSWKRE